MEKEKTSDTIGDVNDVVLNQENVEMIQGEDGTFFPAPTEKDWSDLRQVADSVPKSAFLVILLEFCERFTYYGLNGPFQNYIQQPAPPSCKYQIDNGEAS